VSCGGRIRAAIFLLAILSFLTCCIALEGASWTQEKQQRQRNSASNAAPKEHDELRNAAPDDENAYCGKGNVPHFGEKDGPAELPKSCYYTAIDGTPSPGKKIKVSRGSDLAKVIDKASCGDTVLLAAGESYEMNDFPRKNCDDQHYITVRTDSNDSKLPRESARISPAWGGVASLPGRPQFAQPSGGPAKIMATIAGTNAWGVTIGDHYRFIGIEWMPASGKKIGRLLLTSGADHLIFDRNWFHGFDGQELGKGIGITNGSRYIAIIHSYLNSFTCTAKTGSCTDATAIGGGNGDDPVQTIKIVDNFLEASGENVLFGGAKASIRVEDVEMRRNHHFKPMWWNPNSPDHREPTPIVKNLFELKSGNRVLLESSYLENSWAGFSQVGAAILLTTRNNYNKRLGIATCPKCAITNVTIRYVWIRKVNQAFQFTNPFDYDRPAPGNSYSVHDVVAEGMGYPECGKGCGGALNLISGGPAGTPIESVMHDLTIDHVTYVSMKQPKDLFILGGPPSTGPNSPQMYNIRWTNTVADVGTFGAWSKGGGESNCAEIRPGSPKLRIEACWGPTGVFKGNVLAGANRRGGAKGAWPDGNYYAEDQESIGFVKVNGGLDGDYHLAPSSRFKGKGLDGKDPGADVTAVIKSLEGVR